MQTKVNLVMYKGPATNFLHKVGHYSTCVFSSIRHLIRRYELKYIPYSHAELVINGICYSSSSRDGGVRSKYIDYTEGKWDIYEITIDIEYALDWFNENKGKKYDWAGILRFAIPFLPQNSNQLFCNEALGKMTKVANPEDYTPYEYLEIMLERNKENNY